MKLAEHNQSAVDTTARENAQRLRFVLDGHVFVGVAEDDAADALPGQTKVGGLTCSGTRYILYEEPGEPIDAAPDVPSPERAPGHSLAEILTRRELQVALLISDGRCDKEIARQLGISGYTVREHLRRIFAKLKIGRRSALVAFILRTQPRLMI